MNINLDRYLIIVFSIVLQQIFCFATESPFSASSISSCFGPRIPPTKTSSKLHQGIDYAQNKGTPIKAVDSGILKAIEPLGDAGWVLSTKSKSGDWSYLHTFSNDNLEVGLFKIMYKNGIRYIYRKASKDYERKKFYLEQNITRGELFAPVGDSGVGTGPHLHLNLNHQKNNPLSQFADIPSGFKVEMQKPQDGAEISSNELRKDYDIHFNIDTTQGKDLNNVVVYLDGKEQGSFCYGGIPGGEPQKNVDPTDGSKNGINPKSAFKCEFLCLSDFSNLSDGEHEIKIKTIDVKNNTYENKFEFKVKKDEIDAVGEISYECTYYTGLEASSNGDNDCGFEIETNKYLINILNITKNELYNIDSDKFVGGGFEAKAKIIYSQPKLTYPYWRGNPEFEHIIRYETTEVECTVNVAINNMSGYNNGQYPVGLFPAVQILFNDVPQIDVYEKEIAFGELRFEHTDKQTVAPFMLIADKMIVNDGMIEFSKDEGELGKPKGNKNSTSKINGKIYLKKIQH